MNCAHSEILAGSAWASVQSDQSLCCPHEEALGPWLPIKRTTKTLIRMGECPDWSESSLGTQVILLLLSCCSSLINALDQMRQRLFKIFNMIALALAFSLGPRQANLLLIAYASSEGSGEPAHPRSLARTFAARSYKQWIKRNLQTESQIRGPSEWLGMRGWNLSWRNARRHKFAWRGSLYFRSN